MKTIMIAGAAAVALVGLATAALAQSGGQLAVAHRAPTPRPMTCRHGSKEQTVIITTRDLKDGETVTPHIHHGVEMTQVVTGTFECYLKGLPMKLRPRAAKAP